MPIKWDIKRIAEMLGFLKHRHNCDHTLRRVMLALDGEMNAEEEKSFLEELNSCSQCLEKYHIEKSFKNFLRQKITRHSVSSQCIEKIRSQISSSQ